MHIISLDVVKSDDKLTGQLRFRKRALGRLQAVLDRIPTKHGILHPKVNIPGSTLARLALRFVDISSSNNDRGEEDKKEPLSAAVLPTGSIRRGCAALYRPGWSKASTKPLEKRPDYMIIPAEPKLSSQSPHATQTVDTQMNMLIACGLHSIIGLVRQGLLLPKSRAEDTAVLVDVIHPTLNALNTSNNLTVLAAAVRCVKIFFFHLQVEGFDEEYLPHVARALFGLVDKHAGMLSSRTTAKDSAAQSFAYGLYATLAAFIQQQTKYTLSNAQLGTLFSTIEAEVVRDSATSPVLSLLVAFLSRRLRDPEADEDSDNISFLPSIEEPVDGIVAKGLVVSKSTDKDFSFVGAGGGQRLSNLMLRLQRLAVTSSNETVRRDCRRCLLTYLLNYPHQKRFIVGFIDFLLRQLEHKREIGRASVATLLCMIVSELPQSALVQGALDETILLAVGAAIERETSVSVRLSLYGLVRLLFSRLPGEKAASHFEEYFLAFLRAPMESRASAKLLGLQVRLRLLSDVLE